MQIFTGLVLVFSLGLLIGCSHQNQRETEQQRADQRTAQQIEATERGAREAHRRLDQY
ncbi:hypothetical protein JX580_10625 [Thiomicrospira microaerophila]|uniref:hypothetical protein n=1 Tax=Thiomicrospira microaerophila TaxID=406020 RepID=UPI00200D89FE|nr:hypothetical protein [Thiomicrospira microaerophila]UQB42098.1 hypothetical protein JX580_10625 [Thiomicrospira microaerophila]